VIPPRVDYQLTDLGRSLFVPVRALGAWAKEHGAEIERAQVHFDRTKAADAESSGGVKSSGATPMRAYPPMDSP
jgi:hypothetical protein